MKKNSEAEPDRFLKRPGLKPRNFARRPCRIWLRYPKEIERLKIKRNQVREELRTVLTTFWNSPKISSSASAVIEYIEILQTQGEHRPQFFRT